MHAATAGRFEDHPAPVNISPWIDLVFILLIFFIVTTVFVDEQGMKVAAADLPPPRDVPVLMLQLTAGGEILHENRSITPSGITALVRGMISTAPTAVVVEVEPEVSAQRVVSVIDSARLGGADDVRLMSAIP